MSDKEVVGEKWLDIGDFGWLVRYSHSTHCLDFAAHEAVSVDDDGAKRFDTAGYGCTFTDDPSKAEAKVSGFVKWDGCCEFRLCEAAHFCGAAHVAIFARVLVELHRLCLLLPNVDRKCAGYDEGAP